MTRSQKGPCLEMTREWENSHPCLEMTRSQKGHCLEVEDKASLLLQGLCTSASTSENTCQYQNHKLVDLYKTNAAIV